MNARICSMKALFWMLRNREIDPKKAAFVISSSYPMEEQLRGLRCVFEEYQDLNEYRPGLSLSKSAAAEMAAFVMQLDETVETCYFVCDSGIRRSSAACAAVLRLWGRNEEERAIWCDPGKEPNPYVFKLLCAVLDHPIGDTELTQRIELNREAVRRAFRRK